MKQLGTLVPLLLAVVAVASLVRISEWPHAHPSPGRRAATASSTRWSPA